MHIEENSDDGWPCLSIAQLHDGAERHPLELDEIVFHLNHDLQVMDNLRRGLHEVTVPKEWVCQGRVRPVDAGTCSCRSPCEDCADARSEYEKERERLANVRREAKIRIINITQMILDE